MTKESQGEYIRKVQEDTRRYVEKLLKENETLRAKIARLDSEKLGLEEELSMAQEQIERHRKEQLRLERQLAQIEADNRRFTKEYLDIEERNANLANLYVASYRLHGSLQREEVLEVIQEILINLVGSEEIAIFEREGSALRLASSFGIETDGLDSVPVGEGRIGGVAKTAEAFFYEGDTELEDGITACVPLLVEGDVIGVIVVYRLLPQKPCLGDADRELFDLLGTHSAVALYCARLHAETALTAGSR